MKEQLNDSVENENPVENPKTEDKVAYETYLKVLSEAKKAKQKSRELESRLSQFEEEIENSKKHKLEEENKYKELNEILVKEKEEFKLKHEALSKKIIDSYKLQAFKDSLPGKIPNSQYLKFVDLDRIIMDEENKVNPESVKVAVDQFMSEHSLLVKMEESELPSDSPKNTKTGGLTEEEFKALPLAEKKKRLQEFRAAEKARGGF